MRSAHKSAGEVLRERFRVLGLDTFSKKPAMSSRSQEEKGASSSKESEVPLSPQDLQQQRVQQITDGDEPSAAPPPRPATGPTPAELDDAINFVKQIRDKGFYFPGSVNKEQEKGTTQHQGGKVPGNNTNEEPYDLHDRAPQLPPPRSRTRSQDTASSRSRLEQGGPESHGNKDVRNFQPAERGPYFVHPDDRDNPNKPVIPWAPPGKGGQLLNNGNFATGASSSSSAKRLRRADQMQHSFPQRNVSPAQLQEHSSAPQLHYSRKQATAVGFNNQTPLHIPPNSTRARARQRAASAVYRGKNIARNPKPLYYYTEHDPNSLSTDTILPSQQYNPPNPGNRPVTLDQHEEFASNVRDNLTQLETQLTGEVMNEVEKLKVGITNTNVEAEKNFEKCFAACNAVQEVLQLQEDNWLTELERDRRNVSDKVQGKLQEITTSVAEKMGNLADRVMEVREDMGVYKEQCEDLVLGTGCENYSELVVLFQQNCFP